MNKERGVTLVELMVAVAILSFIMIAFFTIFKGATSAWRKGETRTELVQNGRIALDRMASEIRQALPADPNASPSIEEIRVCLGSDTIEAEKDEPGDRIIFQAALDTVEGPEEIRFSCRRYNDEITNTLYKRARNPVDTDGDGILDSYPPLTSGHDHEVTAGGIVTDLTFVEASRPHGVPTKPVLITINLTLEDLEEEDVNRREKVTLTTKVKLPYAYGKGVAGD